MTRTARDPSSEPTLQPQDGCTTCHTRETAVAHSTRRRIGRKGRIAIAALCSALLFSAGGVAVAATARDSADGPHEGVRVARGNAQLLQSTTWTDLPGGSVEFFMPAFHRDLYVARFSATSRCFLGCHIRILIDGQLTSFSGPASFLDRFDGSSGNAVFYERHSTEQSLLASSGLFGRTVRVVVQYRVDDFAHLDLHNWHLTAERVHQSTLTLNL